MDLASVLCFSVVVNYVACIPLRFHAVEDEYRAAVYEHAVHIPWDSLVYPVPRHIAVRNMMKNIRVYEEQTAIAAQQDADIIVFPEDGIYGMIFNRDTIKPFLEEIPDPREVTWIPCNLPENVTDIDIQRKLSCMAKENGIYVVANMGDRKSCNQSNNPKCPDDGQYQFNTDVVFDSSGKLVARYHKRHLFKEGQFDTPELEVITFDTPFATFGLFTCFDILFYQPAVELVQKQGVKNIIFPTAWMDRLPNLAAIEFHSAFAKGLGVTVLAANIHFPIYKFHGSGIYTPKGSVNYYYSDNLLSGGKLLISGIDSRSGLLSHKEGSVPTEHKFRTVMTKIAKDSDTKDYLKSPGRDQTVGDESHDSSPTFGSTPGPEGEMILPRQNYTFVSLATKSGTQRACHDYVCCKLVYSKAVSSPSSDLYVLAAFSGFDDGRFTEVCSVLKCPDDTLQTCGEPARSADTVFDFLELSGGFSTPYIFPEVMIADGDFIGIVQGEWNYSNNTILGEQGFSKPLLTASLFGRVYSRDNTTNT